MVSKAERKGRSYLLDPQVCVISRIPLLTDAVSRHAIARVCFERRYRHYRGIRAHPGPKARPYAAKKSLRLVKKFVSVVNSRFSSICVFSIHTSFPTLGLSPGSPRWSFRFGYKGCMEISAALPQHGSAANRHGELCRSSRIIST